MATSGALSLADFPSQTVEIACSRCDRHGRYAKARLAAKYGPGIALPELLRRISGDCPQRAQLGTRSCGARYPLLASKAG